MSNILPLLICYIACGASLQLIAVSGIRPIGYVVGAFIWPWLLWADDTPRIRPYLRWARGEIVIEQSEWPIGVFRQTVQRRDGSEYYTDTASRTVRCELERRWSRFQPQSRARPE